MAWLTCSSEGLSQKRHHVEVGSTVNIQRTLFACSLCLLHNHMSRVAPSLLPMCLAPAAVKGTHRIHVHCGSDGSVPTSLHLHKQMPQNRDIPSWPRGCSVNAHFLFIPSPFCFSCRMSHPAASSYLAHWMASGRCESNAVTVLLHREWVWRVTRRLCRWSVQRNMLWPALLQAWRSARRPRSLLRLRYPQLSTKANLLEETSDGSWLVIFFTFWLER